MDAVAEAYLRAEIVAEIEAMMPKEIHTEWENGYAKGLKKAASSARGYNP